jgi:hypothetical protein
MCQSGRVQQGFLASREDICVVRSPTDKVKLDLRGGGLCPFSAGGLVDALQQDL